MSIIGPIIIVTTGLVLFFFDNIVCNYSASTPIVFFAFVAMRGTEKTGIKA
jgi:hypothetical protein